MSERKRKKLSRLIQAYADREYPHQNVEASIVAIDTDYVEENEMITVSFFRNDNPDWGFNLKVFAYLKDKPLFIMGMIAQSLMDRETH